VAPDWPAEGAEVVVTSHGEARRCADVVNCTCSLNLLSGGTFVLSCLATVSSRHAFHCLTPALFIFYFVTEMLMLLLLYAVVDGGTKGSQSHTRLINVCCWIYVSAAAEKCD